MTLDRRRRETARIILTDDQGRVLLFRGGDPHRPEAGTWWFTPGGGIDPGESASAAARRELLEETGFEVADVGEVIAERRIEHEFAGVIYDQRETYFRVRAAAFEVDTSRWTDVEVATVAEHRWWTPTELAATTDRVFPERLLDLLDHQPLD